MLWYSVLALLAAEPHPGLVVRGTDPSPRFPVSGSPFTADTDTTISVSPGARLRVETMGGDIIVKVWDRNLVRIQASHSRRTRVEVRRSGAEISLEASAQFGPGGMVDYELTVPAWMSLKLGGISVSVTVDGSRAPIEAETIEGDITVKGGAESVKLSTVDGEINVSGVRGRLELSSASSDIRVSDLQGDLALEAISGDVYLRGIKAKSVEVGSVSGDVWFEGELLDGGRYSLATHSGNINLAIAEGVNATVASRVFSGSTRASFTLPPVEQASRRQSRFRFGNGSAMVELDAFSGNVQLLRPAELFAQLDRRLRERQDKEQDRHQEIDHDIPE